MRGRVFRSPLTCRCGRSMQVRFPPSPCRWLTLGYYPRLLRLLNELDVAVRPDDLTFSFSRQESRIPYLIYNGLTGLKGLSVPATKSYLLAFLKVIYYSLSFIYLCIVCLLHYHLHFFRRIKDITFEQFCTEYFIPQQFSQEVLVPLYSAVCTCKESDILKYPAGLIVGNYPPSTPTDLDYIAAVFGTRHYTIASPHGFRTVVHALTSSIPRDRIHLSMPLSSISGSCPIYSLHSDNTTFGPFSQVILATPAPISASILPHTRDFLPIRKALKTFRYVPVLVVTHTDPSFIPRAPSLQRDLHFQRRIQSPEVKSCKGMVESTHILHYHSPYLRSSQVFQTTNPLRSPQKEMILSQTWFERYLPSLESVRMTREIFSELGQGREGIWFVGSWLAEGIPLLEGCVESAEDVVERMISQKPKLM